MQSLQSQLKILEASATSPLVLVPLARQLLDLPRKSAALPPAELQASLASDALSKFDGSTAHATPPSQRQSPPAAHQPPVAEAHRTPPAPTETAFVPPEPAAAAPVIPVAEPRGLKTPPPEGGSTETKEEEEEARQEEPPAQAATTTTGCFELGYQKTK